MFPPQLAIIFKGVTTTLGTRLSEVKLKNTCVQEDSFTLMSSGVYEIQLFIELFHYLCLINN